jgi:hypothetical protein
MSLPLPQCGSPRPRDRRRIAEHHPTTEACVIPLNREALLSYWRGDFDTGELSNVLSVAQRHELAHPTA